MDLESHQKSEPAVASETKGMAYVAYGGNMLGKTMLTEQHRNSQLSVV